MTIVYVGINLQLPTGQWFSPVSSTNKSDCYNITEILLKVVLNTINQTTNNKLTSSHFVHSSFGNTSLLLLSKSARLILKSRSSLICLGSRLMASFTYLSSYIQSSITRPI